MESGQVGEAYGSAEQTKGKSAENRVHDKEH